ncbi:hypothetical protein KI387_032884, partial [Taxus chinensis]
FYGVNQAPSHSVAANTPSKKRNIGERQSSDSSDPQPSITPQGIGNQSAASNVQGQPKPPPRPAQVPIVTTQVQENNMQGKGKQRDNSSPFNIIEQMKRTNVNIS